MNTNQKIVLIIGAIAILVQLFFFTPYSVETRGMIVHFEYGCYFKPAQWGSMPMKLDDIRLIISLILTIGLFFGLFLFLKDKKK